MAGSVTVSIKASIDTYDFARRFEFHYLRDLQPQVNRRGPDRGRRSSDLPPLRQRGEAINTVVRSKSSHKEGLWP
jgi:hypothetical protein